MGLTAAMRWAQVRAAGGQPPAALPLSPEEKARRRKALDEVSRLGYEMQVEQPKGRRARKPKVTTDEP